MCTCGETSSIPKNKVREQPTWQQSRYLAKEEAREAKSCKQAHNQSKHEIAEHLLEKGHEMAWHECWMWELHVSDNIEKRQSVTMFWSKECGDGVETIEWTLLTRDITDREAQRLKLKGWSNAGNRISVCRGEYTSNDRQGVGTTHD